MWTSPARAGLAGDVLDLMGDTVRPLAVGGPRSSEVQNLGRRLDCPAGDDLRKLLIEWPAAFLLVTSLRDVGPADLRAAAEAGTRVICFEPLAAEFNDQGRLNTPTIAAATTFAPAFLRCPGYLRAADPLDPPDSPRLIRFTSHGQPHQGSLLARLLDAWTTALAFTALPETITATLTGPTSPARQISGQLAAHARIADGGSVLIEVTDTAAHTRRELSVVSEDVQLIVGDTAYELRRGEDAVPEAGGQDAAQPTFVDLVAHQWQALLQHQHAAAPAGPLDQALACVHACLLSARTSQPERPGKLLELSR